MALKNLVTEALQGKERSPLRAQILLDYLILSKQIRREAAEQRAALALTRVGPDPSAVGGLSLFSKFRSTPTRCQRHLLQLWQPELSLHMAICPLDRQNHPHGTPPTQRKPRALTATDIQRNELSNGLNCRTGGRTWSDWWAEKDPRSVAPVKLSTSLPSSPGLGSGKLGPAQSSLPFP